MSSRQPDAEHVAPVFLQRWSPRSFSDEPVTDAELATVFEAARWAPSWLNNQPWNYLYATEDPDRTAFLDVFVEGNRRWARSAPVVGLVVARTQLEGEMARSRDFDAGSATGSMLTQATMLGLSGHLLGGIELDDARALVGVDGDSAEVICGFVLGRRGDPAALPDELREREHPSSRRPVSSFAIRGTTLPPPPD